MLSPAALTDLAARLRVVGMNLHKQRLKGEEYRAALGRQMAALAETFDCRGWMESAEMTGGLFDEPGKMGEAPEGWRGQVDVMWSRHGAEVAVFEIGATVRARSLERLMEAGAAHRFWVYFGRDLWSFRAFLQKNDPERRITPVVIPQTFVPSFSDPARREPEEERGVGPSEGPRDLSE